MSSRKRSRSRKSRKTSKRRKQKGGQQMSNRQKKEIALKFMVALQKCDANLFKSIVTPDFVWTVPGTSIISGEALGVDGILQRCKTIHQYGAKLTIEHIFYGTNDIGLGMHNTGQHNNKLLDEHLIILFRLSNNKIQRIDNLLLDIPMLNKYFV
ncbi:MAG: hypothetical protein Hyperionvirus1_5 [Hyperionvirus sp.]|uniref:SnoaL-like domain-containing protein n=1 Tax=Hyperionvirus sp. TaxID=2487770 RepID=A0A3G5A5B0_9VIRU|nr:MAG: hypothetical protein Hyperionvirus1_5 [Hyperionvirus sp.]